MIVDVLLKILLCGLLAALVKESFGYRHILHRKKTVKAAKSSGPVHLKKSKVPPAVSPAVQQKTDQDSGPTAPWAEGGLLHDLPGHLQDIVQNALAKGAQGILQEGDSITVTSVTTNGKTHYQFTDGKGKVQTYSSTEEMDPQTKALLDGWIGDLGPSPKTGKVPEVSVEEALASALAAPDGQPSSGDPKSMPSKRCKPAERGKLAYIPLEPEAFVADDDEGDS